MKIRREPQRLQQTEQKKLPTLEAPSSAAKTTPPPSKPSTPPPLTALPSTSSSAPKQAGQNGAPVWATPELFQQVAARLGPPGGVPSGGAPLGGKGLSVRIGALTLPKTSTTTAAQATPTTPPAHLKKKSQTLLDAVKRSFTVVGGRPLTTDEIAGLGKTIHLTREKAVQPILSTGLRPTTSALANWSTWAQHTVYMFPAPPKKGSLEDKVVRRQGMTEVIEIDLKKLDPDRLFKRVIDGAILYLTDKPIEATALRHLGNIDDVMPHSTAPNATKAAVTTAANGGPR